MPDVGRIPSRRKLRPELSRNYYRVRIRNPLPDAKTRMLILSKEKGYEVVTQQKPNGKWEFQSVLIERRKGRNKRFAKEKAAEIARL